MHKTFQTVKLGKPQVIVNFRGMAIAIFGTLPKFARVDAAGKHGPVLLRLVPENGEFFPFQIVRTDRHHAVDLMRLPFLPSPAILPNFKVLALAPDLANPLHDSIEADPVGAVRIGEVAGDINLGGL